MKAPRFWLQQPGLLARLLLPISLLFRMGGGIRRFFASPYRAKIPVICVGNIVAGGAGKTPTALAIAEILTQANAKPVFVTRGYGGKENGPLRVNPTTHKADAVGDEALLLAKVAPVFIGRDRVAAIKAAESIGTHLILDDGMQNPSIRPNVSLLVIDSAVGLGNGYVIPAGPLRETLDAAMRRITAVILVGERDEQNIVARVQCPVIRAHLEPVLSPDFPKAQKFLAFAGIGRPEKFYETCRNLGLTLAETQNFPDHHAFTAAELSALQKHAASLNAQLLTTEKDFVRLPENIQSQTMVLPVKLVFDDAETIRRILQSS